MSTKATLSGIKKKSAEIYGKLMIAYKNPFIHVQQWLTNSLGFDLLAIYRQIRNQPKLNHAVAYSSDPNRSSADYY